MQTINQKTIPEHYFYYRSHARAYGEWIARRNPSWQRVDLPDGSFWWLEHWLWGLVSFARFEKVSMEPTRELLASHGMKRGVVFWSPWGTEKPDSSWKKLTGIFTRGMNHSSRSAFSILESPDYFLSWPKSEQSRRKKIRESIRNGEISILSQPNPELFLEKYKKYDSSCGYFLERQKFLFKNFPDTMRCFLVSMNGEIVAGAVFLDDFLTSTYLIAFQDKKAKPYHLGLAILDYWHEDSYAKWFRYLDFDHMRSPWETKKYTGYTEFKAKLADYDIVFDEVWTKWF